MNKFKGLIAIVIIMLVTAIFFESRVSAKPDNSAPEISIKVEKLSSVKEVNNDSKEVEIEILKESPIDEYKKYVVTADVLRVRFQPNTWSDILGKLPYGTEIKPLCKLSNNWYKIEYKGMTGYVCGDYINAFLPEDPENKIGSNFLIVINSKYNTLNIYKDGSLFESYQCATGKKSSPSPEGNFQIVCKYINPSWKGKVAGGDPSNPLGKRWMGLSVPGTGGSKYGIHGNSDESSIGKNVSGGCIRMHNSDVEYVFEYLPLGTEVIISSLDDTDQNIAASYGFIIK